MPNITKIKVNGTSYDVEDAAATQNIAGLDTALVNFQNSAGAANGLATLDSTVKVPSTQMPMAAINNYIASNTRDSVLVTTNSPSISVTSYDNIGLRVGLGLSITFLVDVTASSSTDTMTISYNGGNAIPIKVAKDGSIVNFAPNQISSTWKFVQTGVTLEVRYIENGGSTYWLIVGNPVVLSSSTNGYTIYADSYSIDNVVQDGNMHAVTSNAVNSYLEWNYKVVSCAGGSQGFIEVPNGYNGNYEYSIYDYKYHISFHGIHLTSDGTTSLGNIATNFGSISNDSVTLNNTNIGYIRENTAGDFRIAFRPLPNSAAI